MSATKCLNPECLADIKSESGYINVCADTDQCIEVFPKVLIGVTSPVKMGELTIILKSEVSLPNPSVFCNLRCFNTYIARLVEADRKTQMQHYCMKEG